MQNNLKITALMEFLSVFELKTEYLDSSNFKLLFEKEIDM